MDVKEKLLRSEIRHLEENVEVLSKDLVILQAFVRREFGLKYTKFYQNRLAEENQLNQDDLSAGKATFRQPRITDSSSSSSNNKRQRRSKRLTRNPTNSPGPVVTSTRSIREDVEDVEESSENDDSSGDEFNVMMFNALGDDGNDAVDSDEDSVESVENQSRNRRKNQKTSAVRLEIVKSELSYETLEEEVSSEQFNFNKPPDITTEEPPPEPIKYIKSVRGKEMATLGGYGYIQNKSSPSTDYYYCDLRRSNGCVSRFIVYRNGTYKISGDHNHPPDYERLAAREITMKGKQLAVENQSLQSKDVAEQIEAMIQSQPGNCSAYMGNKESILRQIRRARQAARGEKRKPGEIRERKIPQCHLDALEKRKSNQFKSRSSKLTQLPATSTSNSNSNASVILNETTGHLLQLQPLPPINPSIPPQENSFSLHLQQQQHYQQGSNSSNNESSIPTFGLLPQYSRFE